MTALSQQVTNKISVSVIGALLLFAMLSGCSRTRSRPVDPQLSTPPTVVYMSELEWRTGAVLSPRAPAKQSESYLTGRNGLVRQTFSALAATSRTLVPHPMHIGSRPARAWLTVDENGCEKMACLEIASTSGSITMAFEPEVEYPGLVWKGRCLLLNAHVKKSERYLLLNPHVKGSDTLYWVSLEDDRVDVANLMPGLLPDEKSGPATVTVVAKNLDRGFLSLCLGVESNGAPFATARRYMKIEDIENWCRRGRRYRSAAPEAGLLVEPAATAAGPNDRVGIRQSAPEPGSVVLAGTNGNDVVETPWQQDEERRAWEKNLAAWQTGTIPRPLLPVSHGLRAADPATVAWQGANTESIRYLA